MQASWDREPPSLLPAIVCYADILGFREMVEQAFESGEGDEFLRRIKHSLDRAYYWVHQRATRGGKADPPMFQLKLFTDNIVVAYPLRNLSQDFGEPELVTMLDILADVQASLAADGFFLRGGITVGEHYQDEDLVYGDAFLKAYDLDRSGTPPKLVIDHSVEYLISKHLSFYSGMVPPHHSYMLEDPNADSLDSSHGKLFVNYLWAAVQFFPDFINHSLLEAHSKAVSSNLEKYASNPHIWTKYAWLATYHNYFCSTIANQAQGWDRTEADPEEMMVRANTWRTRDHLIDFNARPRDLSPHPFDEEQLRQRVANAGPCPQ